MLDFNTSLDGRCLVIIPTKNEVKNISGIVNEILKSYTFSILIVDDNSVDGTQEKIIKNIFFNSRLFLLERKSNFGLGKSYIDGFKWAIREKYQYIFQMDGDGFHLPSELVNLIDTKQDCVIASRWMKNSTIDHNWPKLRKFVSWILNFLIKIGFLLPVLDSSSGFRFIKTSILKNINFDKFISRGYCFQQELLLNISSNGGKIIEKPVHFGYRLHGKSKVNFKIILELCYILIVLFFINIWKQIRSLKKKTS